MTILQVIQYCFWYFLELKPTIKSKNGNKFWFRKNKWHRLTGPAVILNNGDKAWYLEGELQRVENVSGYTAIFKNGKMLEHYYKDNK